MLMFRYHDLHAVLRIKDIGIELINDGPVVICTVWSINAMVIEMDVIVDTWWLFDDYKGLYYPLSINDDQFIG